MACLPRPAPCFARVEMPAAAPQPDVAETVSAGPAVAAVSAMPLRPAGLIEILLPDGVNLRVDAAIDAAALRRVLTAVRAR
jgi:hypothetical protein